MGIFERVRSGLNTKVEDIRVAVAQTPEVSQTAQENAVNKAKSIMEGNELITTTDATLQRAVDLDKKATDAGAFLAEASEKYSLAGTNEARYLALEAKLNRGKISDEEMTEMESLEEAGLNQEVLKQAKNQAAREKIRRDREVISARGEKPKRDYEHEKKLRDESEKLQAEALKFAYEAVNLFPEDPTELNRDTLRQISALVRNFRSNERSAIDRLDKIRESMAQRFPDDAEDYQAKFDSLVEDYSQAKRVVDQVILLAESGELAQDFDEAERRSTVGEVLAEIDIINLTLSSEDLATSLLEGGLTISENQQMVVEAGSLAEKFINQQAIVTNLEANYSNILEASKDSPQAVDRLLELAKKIIAHKNNLRTAKAELKAKILTKAIELKNARIKKEAEEKGKVAAAQEAIKRAKEREKARADRRQRLDQWAQSGIQMLREVADKFDKMRTDWVDTRKTVAEADTRRVEDAKTPKIVEAQKKLDDLQAALAAGAITAEEVLNLLSNETTE